jgi:hypothetical protein
MVSNQLLNFSVLDRFISLELLLGERAVVVDLPGDYDFLFFLHILLPCLFLYKSESCFLNVSC